MYVRMRDVDNYAAPSGSNAQSAEKLMVHPTQRPLINYLNRRQLTGIPFVARRAAHRSIPSELMRWALDTWSKQHYHLARTKDATKDVVPFVRYEAARPYGMHGEQALRRAISGDTSYGSPSGLQLGRPREGR